MFERHYLQIMVSSRCYLRKPGTLVNSIPKSGTHLAKEILIQSGLKFAGHHHDRSFSHLEARKLDCSVFVTGHISKTPSQYMNNILITRNPVDVIYSMVSYIKRRRDHPRHAKVANLGFSVAAEKIIDGDIGLDPIFYRFVEYYKWAQHNGAHIVDFSLLKENPSDFIDIIGVPLDKENIDLRPAILNWNPTRRRKKDKYEDDIKNSINKKIERSCPELFDLYFSVKEGGVR